MQRIKTPRRYFWILSSVKNLNRKCSIIVTNITTTIESTEHDLMQRYNTYQSHGIGLRYIMEMDNNRIVDITGMTTEEIDCVLQDLIANNRDKQVIGIVNECLDKRKLISLNMVKKLYRHYSITGKVDLVKILQIYCSKVDRISYKRNGEFIHYLAKAQCMKGNSEQGLSTLRQAYIKNEGLRGFYRIIFRELINDSVLNRSEATMVIFRKFVLEFSDKWNDHYPLICYWHICWSSTWYSDQVTSNDLLDMSEILREIVRDKASTFSINILREYNEDAVVRLLQSLLKYDMMEEYAIVLQILFNYKIKNKDLRGCMEIVRNCKALGISLPSDQHGRYIKMLIYKEYTDYKLDDKTNKPPSKSFKLKF